MSINELLQNHPAAKEVVKSWFMEKMMESFKDQSVPEEIKQFMLQQGIPDEQLVAVIGDNPRALFDVFDENKVYIHVEPFSNALENDLESFGWRILGEEYSNLDCKTRKEAENQAVTKAFSILEEKLTPQLSMIEDGPDSTTSNEQVQTA